MGLIFVGPLIVPEYPAALQSTGRYLALGLIALPLAARSYAFTSAQPPDWMTALALTMMGNLIYYVCGERHSAYRRAGIDHDYRHAACRYPRLCEPAVQPARWQTGMVKMVPALICTGVGLVCVNIAELRHGLADFSVWRYGSGIGLAFISVACWAVCPA